MKKIDCDQSETSGYGKDAKLHLVRSRILTDEERFKLTAISAEIAASYNISDIKAHLDLLFCLSTIMDTGSEVSITSGQIEVPVDQPTFRKTRERLLKNLQIHLTAAVEILYEVNDNETFATALDWANEDGQLGQHFESLCALAEIADRAVSLRGRAGSQPNEDWVKAFCVECQAFWKIHKGGGTRIIYHTEQDSAISDWVYALYKNMHEFKGRPAEESKLKTAAKYLPA